MSRTCIAVAAGVVTVAVVTLVGGAGATTPARPAQADLIRRFTVRLDARCHVAVLRIRLSRPAPVGIVPDGDPSIRVPLGRAAAAAGAAATTVYDVKIWDLTLPDGTELRPGRHEVVLRALSADRSNVLDTSDPVAYRVPRSFAKAPTRCGA
jgi:hypothetical protein